MVHHRLEERAVVADQEHGGVEAAEIVLEPARGLEVEVVGGLVEQEHVGGRHELLGETEPSPLAAAQLVQRASARLVGVEAEAVEHRVDAGGDRVAALAIEALEIAVVPGQHLRGAAVARLRQGRGLFRQRVLEREQLAEGAGGGLPDRGGTTEIPVLLHDRDSGARSPGRPCRPSAPSRRR